MFPRVDTPELLDEHDAPWPEVERSLLDLRRFNRWLGGTSNYRRLLGHFGADARQTSILDVGTGSSDLIAGLPAGRPRIGLDFKVEHLVIGRRNAPVGSGPVFRVAGDAAWLPFRDGSVDVLTSNHFFHHFGPETNAEILRESLRVARRGVIATDTVRHLAPLLFVLLIGMLRLVGRITRFDAPASVRRGYTVAEARNVAREVGALRFDVVSSFPFRFGILLWK